MTLSTISDITLRVDRLIGSSSSEVSAEGKEQAVEQALLELRWALPQTDQFREYWIIERSRRHIIYILLVESAHKFRFKEIYLHNRFQHYDKLIRMMDADFLKAIENNPLSFDLVSGDEAIAHFSYLTPGFQYDYIGRDVTYSGW